MSSLDKHPQRKAFAKSKTDPRARPTYEVVGLSEAITLDVSSTDGSYEEGIMLTLTRQLLLANEALEDAQTDPDKAKGFPRALANYAELMKQLAIIRERWLVISENRRRLVDIDEVIVAVGPELAEARRRMGTFGKRLGPAIATLLDLTPEQMGAVAETADGMIDEILRSFDAAEAASTRVFDGPPDDLDALMEETMASQPDETEDDGEEDE